ncbi:hypothetical protein [Sphingobacterium multivorum]|uniref:hypothetical protein n=1 Tax=Sphingobacterium multivorum TaxID=28454 RepID=UPI0028A7C31C|nr:hypothetical protein [Sphingobacterium multivorum]
MYQKKDDLSRLIESLSNGERRYLHRAFNSETTTDNKPMYLELFELIRNNKSQIQNEKPAYAGRVLTSNKRFLLKHILKNLRSLHEELSTNIVLNNRLTDIEIIYNHGLPNQAIVILDKAIRLARAQEKFSLLLQLLDWEKRLSITINQPKRSIEQINTEESHVLSKMLQISSLIGLYSKIILLKKKFGYAKDSVKEILETEIIQCPDFPSANKCMSEKAIFYRNLILSIYYWMTFQHQLAFESSQSLLQDKINNILINDFVDGIHQHITSCVCLLRFQEAIEGLRFSQIYIDKHFPYDANPNKQKYIAHYISYSLIIYGYQGKYQKLKEVLQFAEHKLPQCSFLNNETIQVVQGNMMNAYMSTGNFEQAESIWTMLSYESKDVRKDIYADLFLFRIFFLLQTKQYVLLEPASRSALRYYHNLKSFPFEYPLALLFSKPHDYSNPKVRNKLLDQCTHHISTYLSGLHLPLAFQEHYSRYLIWVKAIEQDAHYYEVAQNWHF